VNRELPRILEAREQFQLAAVGRIDLRVVSFVVLNRQLALVERDVVLRRQLQDARAQLVVGAFATILRELLDGVLESIMRQVRRADTLGRVGDRRRDEQLDDQLQWIWCSIRSQRVRVKKWANTEMSPLIVAPVPSS